MISYFLPHKSASNQQHLIDVGLEMLLRDGDASPRFADLSGPGPGELPGQLVSWSGEGTSYLPEQQDWIPAPPDPKRELPKGRFWIGTLKGRKPTPDELQRKADIIYQGVPTKLGDGNTWIIPNSAGFPHYIGINEKGELGRLPTDDCLPHYERTLWAFEHAQAVIEDEDNFDVDKSFEYVIEMLALNYRICPELASQIQLINEEDLLVALSRTTDFRRLQNISEEVKKNSSV